MAAWTYLSLHGRSGRLWHNNAATTVLSLILLLPVVARNGSEAFVVSSPSGLLQPATSSSTMANTRPKKQRQPQQGFRRTASSSSSSSSLMLSLDFQDLLFQTESAANSLATLSLQDPGHLATSLPILYGAGLLTSLSPCVWGLLPLTVSYISTAAGDRADHSTALPTIAFATGLAAVFCSLGVAAVELGGVFGSSSASGVSSMILPVLSNAVCLAMGLKLLELVDLPLPSFQFLDFSKQRQKNRAEPVLIDGKGQILKSKSENDQERGSLVRTFLLGGSSALVASPCATPVLTSILAFVATAANPALGALLLFFYTLGYSTPLLLVAATGGQALVDLRDRQQNGGGNTNSTSKNIYSNIGPWITPLTGGLLLWYGTNGMLTAIFGDPSLAGLTILE